MKKEIKEELIKSMIDRPLPYDVVYKLKKDYPKQNYPGNIYVKNRGTKREKFYDLIWDINELTDEEINSIALIKLNQKSNSIKLYTGFVFSIFLIILFVIILILVGLLVDRIQI